MSPPRQLYVSVITGQLLTCTKRTNNRMYYISVQFILYTVWFVPYLHLFSEGRPLLIITSSEQQAQSSPWRRRQDDLSSPSRLWPSPYLVILNLTFSLVTIVIGKQQFLLLWECYIGVVAMSVVSLLLSCCRWLQFYPGQRSLQHSTCTTSPRIFFCFSLLCLTQRLISIHM